MEQEASQLCEYLRTEEITFSRMQVISSYAWTLDKQMVAAAESLSLTLTFVFFILTLSPLDSMSCFNISNLLFMCFMLSEKVLDYLHRETLIGIQF